jgi:hypothetical protein
MAAAATSRVDAHLSGPRIPLDLLDAWGATGRSLEQLADLVELWIEERPHERVPSTVHDLEEVLVL